MQKNEKFEAWKIAWSNPDSMGLFQYISFNIHPSDVLIIYDLFFPEIIIVDNCVFLAEKYQEASYATWKAKFSEDREAIERVVNHIHIYDLFDNCSEEVDEIVYVQVGACLQKAWQQFFARMYPERNIVVQLVNDEHSYGPTVEFYQK